MTLNLDRYSHLSDATLMLLRVVTGAFLVYGTWDNVTSAERMQEFVGFLAQNGFPWPQHMAPLSVYAQFVCGVLLVLGLVLLGLHFASQGGGRYTVDAVLAGRRPGRRS
jgi:putative oxidoreductase